MRSFLLLISLVALGACSRGSVTLEGANPPENETPETPGEEQTPSEEEPKNPDPQPSVDPFDQPIAWTSADGSELWLKVDITFEGDLAAYRVEATGCQIEENFFNPPHLTKDKYSVFLLDDTAWCEGADIKIDFDYYVDGQDKMETFQVAAKATTTPWAGESVVSQMTGEKAFTGDLDVQFESKEPFALYRMHLYKEDNARLATCSYYGTLISKGTNLFATCADAPFLSGNYRMLLWGTKEDGSEYFQTLRFAYKP